MRRSLVRARCSLGRIDGGCCFAKLHLAAANFFWHTNLRAIRRAQDGIRMAMEEDGN
jgi:hypothetical protein